MGRQPENFLFPGAISVRLKNGLSFSTRVAAWEDLVFLDALYTANMKSHVERVGIWDKNMFRENFEPASLEIIEVEKSRAGFVKISRKSDSLYLAELQIAHQFQGMGIGSAVLEQLIEYGRSKESLITLKVIRGNPAEFLYRRSGFRVFRTSSLHLYMSLYPVQKPCTARRDKKQ